MPDCEQMYLLLFQAEPINYPVVANTHPITFSTFHPVVRISLQTFTHVVNFSLQPALNCFRKITENSIKT